MKKDVTAEMIDRAEIGSTGKALGISAEVIRKTLDPMECVRARKLIGGPAPEQVREQIRESETSLKRDKGIFDELGAQIRGG